MSGTADRLLRLMYEWMKEAEECSVHLRELAEELETLRKECTIVETVGSTMAVAGPFLGAAAAPFTDGLSLVVGNTVAGIGRRINMFTHNAEQFLSSIKLERVKEIDQRCKQIAAKIQYLFQKLREECPSDCIDKRDIYVVKEFIKALLRQNKGNVGIDINARVNSIVLTGKAFARAHPTTRRLASTVIADVVSVMSMFSLKMEGTVLFRNISEGGMDIEKVIGQVVAFGEQLLGAFFGAVLSLPEAIYNWTAAINNNNETEASRSLRDLAQKISRAVKRMADVLKRIKEKLDEEEDDPGEEHLNMALINARSANKWIKPKDTVLIDLIQNNNLDVLLITETWFLIDMETNKIISSILPPNYNIIHCARPYSRGGGVAIVYRNNLVCAQLPLRETSTFEFVASTMTKPGTTETVLILTIYRPPDRSATDFARDFLTEFRMFLIDVDRANFKNVIIGGDFNIWFDRPDLATPREFIAILLERGLVQHVLQPTHEKRHILDLVLSKPVVRITNVAVQSNEFSDHSTVFFTARFKDIIRAMKNLSMKQTDDKKKRDRNNRH